MAESAPRPVISDEAVALYSRLTAGETPGEDDQAALRELLSLGLLREDGPERFVPVDPAAVDARWTAALYAEANRALARAAAVSDALQPLRCAFESRPRGAAGVVEVLRGSDAINGRLGMVLAECTSELLVCQPGGPRKREVLAVSFDRDLAALQRGVKMRTLYHEEARSGEAMSEWVRAMTRAGAEIRTLNEPFLRMIIIDRRTAVIPGDEILVTSPEAVAHIVHDPGVAGFLARAFERDWVRADPWGTVREACKMSERGRMILNGMARGESHDVIARRIGIGRQTMANEIKGLKEVFGVETLFQLARAWTEFDAELAQRAAANGH